MRLSGVNLNLLVVLDALLTEQSVTAAARRMGLSQSATSHALARLREQFDDPLLVRTPEGTVLTVRAAELAGPVRQWIEGAEELLRPAGHFDPASSSMEFRIAMDEATQLSVLPVLFARMRQAAPGISLLAPRKQRETLTRDLRTGACDFAISAEVPPTPKIHGDLLATCDYTCIVRRGHPAVGSTLTLETFVELEHITLARSDLVDPELDRALLACKLRRNVALTVASPGPIPSLVATSDLIATLPRMLLDLTSPSAEVTRYTPPIELDPVAIYLFWHERTQASPAHRWMRGVIEQIFAEIQAPEG